MSGGRLSAREPLGSRLRRTASRNYGAWMSGGLLLILIVVYQAQFERLLSNYQITVLFNGALALVWAAIGLTFVVVAGGFDLSIGSIMSLANVLAASLLAQEATDVLVVVAILGAGALAGLLNGFLVAVVGIQSIIVTLAAMFIWFGVALLIMPQPGGVIPNYFSDIFGGQIGGTVPVAAIWTIGIIVAIAIFRHTAGWNTLFAVGGDDVSARRSGVRIVRARLLAYVAAGTCYALAGLSLSAQSTGGDANIGAPFLLTTFAAVIVGGTPLGGGRGTFLGSVFGAFVIATLGSVLLSLSVTSYWTDIVQGTVLVVAVMVPIAIISLANRGRTTRNVWRR